MNHLQNYITESVLRKLNEQLAAPPIEKLPVEMQCLIEVVAEELDNLQQRCENLEALCNP